MSFFWNTINRKQFEWDWFCTPAEPPSFIDFTISKIQPFTHTQHPNANNGRSSSRNQSYDRAQNFSQKKKKKASQHVCTNGALTLKKYQSKVQTFYFLGQHTVTREYTNSIFIPLFFLSLLFEIFTRFSLFVDTWRINDPMTDSTWIDYQIYNYIPIETSRKPMKFWQIHGLATGILWFKICQNTLKIPWNISMEIAIGDMVSISTK